MTVWNEHAEQKYDSNNKMASGYWELIVYFISNFSFQHSRHLAKTDIIISIFIFAEGGIEKGWTLLAAVIEPIGADAGSQFRLFPTCRAASLLLEESSQDVSIILVTAWVLHPSVSFPSWHFGRDSSRPCWTGLCSSTSMSCTLTARYSPVTVTT